MLCLSLRLSIFLVVTLTALGACSRRSAPAEAPAKPSSTVAQATPSPALDVCALLTVEEIKNISGEAPTAVTPSRTTGGGFEVAQCFYNLPTYSNSIVISVTRRGTGPGARDPREFWETKIKHPEEGEGKEKDRKPDQVAGLGESAFWTGTAVGGALYVLKGDAFVRIGVGTFSGAGTRREKVIELAHLVVKRL